MLNLHSPTLPYSTIYVALLHTVLGSYTSAHRIQTKQL